jgi:hypothetical protein
MAVRANKLKTKDQLTEMQLDHLFDRPLPEHSFEALLLKYNYEGKTKQLWEQHKDFVLAEHVKQNPGTRPNLWWIYSAPRSPLGTYPGAGYDGELPEPRKRLGGIGTPDFEALCYKPCFALGLPVSFISPWDVSYYTGVAVDVNGKLINANPSGTFKGVAIDPDDPPMFESQATYLDRHGLFLPGEKKRLKQADWEDESMCYVDSE